MDFYKTLLREKPRPKELGPEIVKGGEDHSGWKDVTRNLLVVRSSVDRSQGSFPKGNGGGGPSARERARASHIEMRMSNRQKHEQREGILSVDRKNHFGEGRGKKGRLRNW